MSKFKINVVAVFVILVFGFSSCRDSVKESKTSDSVKGERFEYESGVWSRMEYKIEEKTIDSCQYIIIFGVEGRNIIHKANCRNHK